MDSSDDSEATSAAAAAAARRLAAFASDASNHIHIARPSKVESKFAAIVRGGARRLHIISDFDNTMTVHWVDGARGPSSHSVLTRSSLVSEQFRDDTLRLYHTYYPIEISSTIPVEEKSVAMVQWWSRAHEMIIDMGLTRDLLRRIVAERPMTFRRRLDDVIAFCGRSDIPFLVFSAGLYDVIKEILESNSLKPPPVHIVSNRMRWDGEDPSAPTSRCVGFEDPLIHTFNKNEAAAQNAPYHSTLVDRRNIILMGDSLGDLGMADGVHCDTILTIGFLNHDVDAKLPEYASRFDVVITDDWGMDFIMEILRALE